MILQAQNHLALTGFIQALCRGTLYSYRSNFLKWSAKKRGVNAKFISLARLTNLKITDWLIKEICKNEPNTKKLNHKKKILIVGIAYKADVNDVRESPSIRIPKYLLRYNNFVDFHDEKINESENNNRLYKS